MKQRITIILTDDSIGVQNLPDDVVVEIRDYRYDSTNTASFEQICADRADVVYVRRVFGADA